MSVLCEAKPCPVILSSACVFYEGANLIYTGINTNESLQSALQKIDAKFGDAAIGYIFTNGISQSAPGQPVKLGGTLIQDTTITSNTFWLKITGDLEAGKHITTGGTSSQFVKGDGTLDGTSYQPAGAYISALTGDGTASGPGSAVFTLATVNPLSAGTWGSSTQVPIVTVNTKGLITSITSTLISIPSNIISVAGPDMFGSGVTGVSFPITLSTVNSNVYGANTPLKFAVTGKGLVTSAAPLTNLDLDGIYGYTPVTSSRTLTINGVTYDLSANRSWTIGSSLPSQTGNAGKWLTTNGTSASWQPLGGNISLFTNNAGYITLGSLSAGTGINYNGVTGVITNSAPDQLVTLTSGTGISVGGSYPNFTITNSSPDQIVSLTGGTSISIAGSYPNFTINYTGGGGTVTAVTASAPLSSTGGTTPNISITQASGSTNGYLSSTDWNTFNNKQNALTLTTTGTSGAATLIGATLNIPQYTDQYVGTVTSVGLSAGTGISIGGTNPVTSSGTISVTNTAPDQIVALTAGTATTITGTYPNFTIGASYTPVNQAGDTMTGYLTLVGDPVNPLHAATKEYVDLNVTAGIHIHQPVRVETQGNLVATYTDGGTTPTWTTITSNSTLATGAAHGLSTDNVIVFNVTTNGITAGYPYFVFDVPTPTTIRLSLTHAGPPINTLTNGVALTITSRVNSGVGATLVNAGPQSALTIDGIALSVGNRVLVYQQTNGFENGVYDVTSVGSGVTNWVLTRSANENTYDPKSTAALGEGDYFFVQEGTTSAGESYVFTTTGTIVFGTTNLVFTQFGRTIPYTGGTNIDVTGQVISITGQVGVVNGGTGAATLTGALIGDGTNPVTGVTGTAGQVLRRNLADTAYEFYTPSSGGMSRSINSVSINTAAGSTAGTDYVYFVTGITTITLPTAVGNTNMYTIKNVGNNTIVVATTGGQTIDGSASLSMPVKYTSLDFISDGTNWNIV